MLQYILDHWKKLFLQYFVGVVVLFGAFYLLGTLKESVYQTKFTLNPKNNGVEVAHAIDNLFELLMTKDSIAFKNKLGISQEEFLLIKSAEYDILEGSLIEVDLRTRDQGVMQGFYNALVHYLNTDSILNADNNYARKRLEVEMAYIKNQLSKPDSVVGNTDKTLWQFTKENNAEPLVSSRSNLNRIFLENKLSELMVSHFRLEKVRPLNAPVVPKFPEKPKNLVYFIFSNIIVLSLLFVQYLISNAKSDMRED
ncbi:MAG: hypothetical protein RH916_07865 [Vicingaceae bacterium]